MSKREPVRVQRLTLKGNSAQRVGTIDVAPLADQRVAA